MMRWVLAVALATMMSGAMAAQLRVTWVAPTENTDGTPLTDLAGFEIYVGIESRVYDRVIPIEDPMQTEFVIQNLEPGIEYFVTATAVNEAGIMSAYSNEVSKVAPFPTPQPPTDLQLSEVTEVAMSVVTNEGSPRLAARQDGGVQVGREVTVQLNRDGAAQVNVLALGFGPREALSLAIRPSP